MTNSSGGILLANRHKKQELYLSIWPLYPFFVQLFSKKEKKSTAGDGKEVPFSFLGWDFNWFIFLTWGYIRSDTGTWKTLNMHIKVCTQSCRYNIGNSTSTWRYLNTACNSVSNSSQSAVRCLFIQNTKATEIKGNQL